MENPEFYNIHNHPTEQLIRRSINIFRITYIFEKPKPMQNDGVKEDSNLSIRRRSEQFHLCPFTAWNIFRKDIKLH